MMATSGESFQSTPAETPAENKEKDYVHQVYSQIAHHFSDTRYNPWPRISHFLSSLPPGSLVADIGCGNGKYLGVNKDILILGSDICSELVTIARGRGHEVMTCDCLNVPYRSGMFDAVISIAVIHHLSTVERRREALIEMARLLRPGGHLLVYVWAMEQTKRKFSEQDVLIPWHLQPRYAATDENGAPIDGEKKKKRDKKRRKKKTKIKDTDISDEHIVNDDENTDINHDLISPLTTSDPTPSLINSDSTPSLIHPGPTSLLINPDSTSSLVNPDPTPLLINPDFAPSNSTQFTHLHKYGFKTYYRYYHVFIDNELMQLCQNVHTLKVTSSWYDHENWCIEAIKI